MRHAMPLFNGHPKYLMQKRYPRGSEWRKWDLHVHTPSSHVNGFGGDWDRYLNALEALPPEFKVLGINDYLFLDGYRRLLDEKKNKKRLQNIDLLLPVIEFRIKKFAGVEFRTTARINLHVIFSDELLPEVIEAQFLNAIQTAYSLDPKSTAKTWSGVATRESLEALGAAIKSSAPPNLLSQYGTDATEGFNALNVAEDCVLQTLQTSTFLAGMYLTAVGKTEWESLDWNDTSIAEKKDIINGVDLVFTSAESVEAALRSKERLVSQGVNSRMLDCSDAHYYSDSPQKDRVGKCFSWIKADPTFAGLKAVLTTPEERICIGERPKLLDRIAINPTKFIDSIAIHKTAAATTSEKWFNQTIPVNAGLVAIIGKKGSGKSALADVIALLGNTKRSEEFSFLVSERFRDPKTRLAEQFEGTIGWHGGSMSGPYLLSRNPDPASVERLSYVPQSFLEKICNEIAQGQSGRFYAELQEVIFSHIPSSQRLGFGNLAALIEHKTEERQRAITLLREKLSKTNIQLEDLRKRADPSHKEHLRQRYSTVAEEIRSLRKTARPPFVPKPAGETNQAGAITETINRLRQKRTRLIQHRHRIENLRARQRINAELGRKIRARIQNLRQQFETLFHDIEELTTQVDLVASKLVRFTVDLAPVDSLISRSEEMVARSDTHLESISSTSIAGRIAAADAKIKAESERLTAPQRAYERYLEERDAWHAKLLGLIGSNAVAESARGLKAALGALDDIPKEQTRLLAERVDIAKNIFIEKEALRKTYEGLHQPVQDFIARAEAMSSDNQLSFATRIAEQAFTDQFLAFIHQWRAGSFLGQIEGLERAEGFVAAADFTSFEGVLRFIQEIESALAYDVRHDERPAVNLDSILVDGITANALNDFLYGLDYLKPEFEIRWGGKQLSQLSPGEKGNLLLIFYLLVDQSELPLVIDQPEENLDNETVFRTLVPCVREARSRRQVILVTHNPNLAVVCDADQIIHASIQKATASEIQYVSGSIENETINKLLIDVLEGTRPAFNIRDAKYELSK